MIVQVDSQCGKFIVVRLDFFLEIWNIDFAGLAEVEKEKLVDNVPHVLEVDFSADDRLAQRLFGARSVAFGFDLVLDSREIDFVFIHEFRELFLCLLDSATCPDCFGAAEDVLDHERDEVEGPLIQALILL